MATENYYVPDCGRLACPLPFPDGTIGSFYNAAIKNVSAVTWNDEYGDEKYSLEFDSKDAQLKHRALFWNKYLPNEEGDKKLRIVPFAKASDEDAVPVYEVICPQIGQMTGTQGFNLIFWSNLAEGVENITEYDEEDIYKISEKTMANETLSNVSHKALFTASVRFELLKQSGGGISDTNPVLTPVITSIKALYIDDKPISDYVSKSDYMGMFKTYCEYEGEDDEKTAHIYVEDGMGGSSAGICFINQFKFSISDYDFEPDNGMNYVMLYSSGMSDGQDVKPSKPEWYVDTEFPEADGEECYILIARVKYNSTDKSCIISQENYGVAQGFIFAECEDDPGETE